MRIFKQTASEEDKAVTELIEEQHTKESVEVFRRGWCIQQATIALDEPAPDGLIRMARAIYEYVYGEAAK